MGVIVRCRQFADVEGDLLHRICGEEGQLEVEATTVGEVFAELTKRNSDTQLLFDDKGKLRRLFAAFLNEEDIRFLQCMETPVADGDELFILPTVCTLFYQLAEQEFFGIAQKRD